VLEVRYEALISQTEETLGKVLAFLGEPWHDAVLNYYEKAQNRDGEPVESSMFDTRKPVYGTAVGRWRREMSGPDRVMFAREAGSLLQQLGYAPDPWLPASPLGTLSLNTMQLSRGGPQVGLYRQ
jgi:hypothetical protein